MAAGKERVLITFDVPVLVTVDLDGGNVEQVQVAKENTVVDASKGIVSADALTEIPAAAAKQALEIADEQPWPIADYV
jgi:hypothetical protein